MVPLHHCFCAVGTATLMTFLEAVYCPKYKNRNLRQLVRFTFLNELLLDGSAIAKFSLPYTGSVASSGIRQTLFVHKACFQFRLFFDCMTLNCLYFGHRSVNPHLERGCAWEWGGGICRTALGQHLLL